LQNQSSDLQSVVQQQRAEIEAKQKNLLLAETAISEQQKQTAILRQALSDAIRTIEAEREIFEERLVQERLVWEQAKESMQQLFNVEITNLSLDRSLLLEREKELLDRIRVLEENTITIGFAVNKKKRKSQSVSPPINLIPTGLEVRSISQNRN